MCFGHNYNFLFRNVIKLFQEEVSLSMMADRTVRCTIMPGEVHCATAVKSLSQAVVSLLCTVNFTQSTLCVHSASSNLTKEPSRNRTTSHTAIHVL